MVQRRAARMVLSDYRLTTSISPMLQQLQWPTLQKRRAEAKICMMYRIVYNLVDIPASHPTPTISVRGHSMRFQVPYARTIRDPSSLTPLGYGTVFPNLWSAARLLIASRGRCRASDYVRTGRFLTALYVDVFF